MDSNQDAMPPGWIRAPVGDVFEIVTGTTPPKSNKSYYGNDVPFFKPTDLNAGQFTDSSADGLTKEGIKKARLLPAKSVLVTSIGATIGKVGLIRVPGACNQQINALLPNQYVIPEFCYYAFCSLQMQRALWSSASSTTIPIIPKKRFQHLPFLLPPLAEQRRIVLKIDLIFEYADQAEKNITQTQQKNDFFLPTILSAATTGELTSGWRDEQRLGNASDLVDRIGRERIEAWHKGSSKASAKQYPAPQNLEGDDLPLLPIEWAWASLDQLVREGHPIVYGVIKPGPSIEGGVPIVKVNNIVDGAPIDVSSLDRCSPERASKFPRSTLSEGDLVISKDGSIGRVGLVPKELAGGNVTQHVMKVTPHSLIHGPYLMRALQSPFIQKWLRDRTKGVALQGVNVEDFRKIPIPVPSREEQLEIARRLDALIDFSQDINSQVGLSLKGLKSIRQSVLIRAFEGKLVPQDLGDEPASVLLERIRAERAKGKGRQATLHDS